MSIKVAQSGSCRESVNSKMAYECNKYIKKCNVTVILSCKPESTPSLPCLHFPGNRWRSFLQPHFFCGLRYLLSNHCLGCGSSFCPSKLFSQPTKVAQVLFPPTYTILIESCMFDACVRSRFTRRGDEAPPYRADLGCHQG